MENKYALQEKKIEDLTIQVETMRELAVKEDKEIEEAIKAKIQSLTPNKLSIRIDSYRSYSDDVRIEVGFIDEKGKEDFGSTFTMYVYLKPTNCYRDTIYISTGTIGSWCVEDNPYQYSRIILINQILENRAGLWLFIKELEEKHVYAPIFEKLRNELESEEWQLRHDKRVDSEKAIEAKFAVNKEIQLGDNYFIKISRITPARVYYFRGNYRWDSEKFDYDKTHISYYGSGNDIFKKEDLINKIYYAQERNDQNVKFLN